MKISKIPRLIYIVRGHRVMLDRDLAELYGVPTKSVNLAVKRNAIRFPDDFVLRLTRQEASNLKFQIETSSWGGRRKLPQAFTEQGVAMLSSVLRSDRAALVNIAIMRAFVRLRSAVLASKDMAEGVDKLERTQGAHETEIGEHSVEIHKVFVAIRQLRAPRR